MGVWPRSRLSHGMKRGKVRLATGKMYTMTESTFKSRKGRDLSLVCARCGLRVKVGQDVVARYTVGSKIYHLACWESLFL